MKTGETSAPSLPPQAGGEGEEKRAAAGRSLVFQLLLRSGEELRRHGVGLAIRGGRRSLARYPQTGDYITNVSARPGDEVWKGTG
jgi:hypothetical protein